MPNESTKHSSSLGAALRAISLPTPPTDGWSRLQQAIGAQQMHSTQVARRRRRQRIGLALAAALGLIAVLVLPSQLREPGDPAPAAGTQWAVEPGEPVTSELDALIARSAQLEAQLDWLQSVPGDGDALGMDLALIDRLQWIDQLLSTDSGSSDTTEVLWRERIELLSRRVALSQRESLIASLGTVPSAPTL